MSSCVSSISANSTAVSMAYSNKQGNLSAWNTAIKQMVSSGATKSSLVVPLKTICL